MVSRANISARPKTGGILSRVINPIGRATGAIKKSVISEGLQKPMPGGQPQVGLDAGTELSRAENIVDPEVPAAAPVNAARGITAVAQAAALRQQAPAQRSGGIGGVMRQNIERVQSNLGARKAVDETGGTRAENAVTAPSLNRSRRPRLNRR